MLRAYKYRLYPNKHQREVLNQNFGACRFVWNSLVANFNSWAPAYKPVILNEKILKDQPENSFLKESISYALQQKRIDFENTKQQYFNKNRKVKLGRMKFKKKGISNDSFRLPGQCVGFNKAIDFEKYYIKIPKIGMIKTVFDRVFTCQLNSAHLPCPEIK